jgi:hypothetical protein
MDELEARVRKDSVRNLTAAGDMDGVQYALQVHEMGLRGVACPEGSLVAAISAFACARASNSVHDLEYAAPAPTVRVYNHLLDTLLCENLVGAVVPMYENTRKTIMQTYGYTYSLISRSCARATGSTACKMLGEMARMLTTRRR